MKEVMNKLWILVLLFLVVISCGDKSEGPSTEKPDPENPNNIKEGLTWSPESSDADKELTITFRAPKSSSLYGEKGDVYLYAGIVVADVWMYQPKEWLDNNTKYKMTKTDDNVWSIKLSPSIRSWFNSGETAINQLGVLIRNADGTKKGINNDSFIKVTDAKFEAFKPGDIKNGALPANMVEGINIIDNNTVTLVLYDKDKDGKRKDFAHVVGDFNNWKLSNDESSQMYRDDTSGTWWITINNLDPTKEYAFQYYVGNKDKETIRIADAYARKILDPDNDKYISASTYPDNKDYPKGGIGIVSVFKTQSDIYNWKIKNFESPTVDNLVIYEMLLRDFTETGDINGAMQKLDYLQTLGVNAIELMPTQEFDGNDSWGYNPAFFFAMDKAYGTEKMYKEFIDACHERGMAVILDVVYNHATGSHPFAKMWWNKTNNKTASNNPYFNVDAPHPYSVFHDFNHESELVQNFVKRNLQFLLEEYNIDGFRFDLTKGFTQNKSNESTASIYDASRVAILKKYNDAIKLVKPEAYVILEHFADNKEETELANEGMMVWRNMNHAYKQSAMGWSDNSSFDGTYYKTSSRPINSLVSYMESHDEERMAYTQTQWGNDFLKTNLTARMSQLAANAAFFFTVPGPKMVWQFGEMGYDISIEENGRTGKKPLKWEYLQNSDRAKLHNVYSKLINLRMQHSELFSSTATMEWKVSASNWSNGRFITLSSFGKSKQVVVVGNFTNSEITTSTTFPNTGKWKDYIDGESLDVATTTMNISIPANSFKIFVDF